MKCCRSCRYWDYASRKVPINALKVIERDKFISVRLGNREARVYSWKWIPKNYEEYLMARYMRVCFYGGKIVFPWDVCKYYEPKYGDKALCEIGSCEYSGICQLFKRNITPYIG